MHSTTLDSPTNDRAAALPRIALIIAVASVLVWLVCLCVLRPDAMCDERIHHYTIGQFCKGKWHLNEKLAMLPTYHAGMSLLCAPIDWVCGYRVPPLWLVRTLNAMAWIAAIAIYGLTLRAQRRDHAADRLLHFAWQPILFTFTGMAYTESFTMVFVALALYLHARRWFGASALAMACACAMRQSYLVWLGFLAVQAALEWQREVMPGASLRTLAASLGFTQKALRLTRIHLLVAVAAVIGVAVTGRISVGTGSGHAVSGFNVGQFYMLAICTLLLWLPLLFQREVAGWRTILRWTRTHAVAAIMLGVLAAGAAPVLARTFSNPHPWNNLDGFYRNWLLMNMAIDAPFRIGVIVASMFVALWMIGRVAQDPNRLTLAAVWMFSILHLLPINRVEPRYALLGLMFVNHWTTFTATQARRLTVWYALLCAAGCVGVVYQWFW